MSLWTTMWPYGAIFGALAGTLAVTLPLTVALTVALIVAGKRGRLLRDALRRASRDRLTGLPTRAELDRTVRTLRRTRRPMVLGLLDLDRFAAFNH